MSRTTAAYAVSSGQWSGHRSSGPTVDTRWTVQNPNTRCTTSAYATALSASSRSLRDERADRATLSSAIRKPGVSSAIAATMANEVVSMSAFRL